MAFVKAAIDPLMKANRNLARLALFFGVALAGIAGYRVATGWLGA